MTPKTLRRKVQKKVKRLQYQRRCEKCGHRFKARVGHEAIEQRNLGTLSDGQVVVLPVFGDLPVVKLTCEHYECGNVRYVKWSGGGNRKTHLPPSKPLPDTLPSDSDGR
jgi:hypothetical protein